MSCTFILSQGHYIIYYLFCSVYVFWFWVNFSVRSSEEAKLLWCCNVLFAGFWSLLLFCSGLAGGLSFGLCRSLGLSQCFLLGFSFGVFGRFCCSLPLVFCLSQDGLSVELSLSVSCSLSLSFSLPLSLDIGSCCGCSLCLSLGFNLSIDLRLSLVLLLLRSTDLLTLSSLHKFLRIQKI